MKSRTHIPGTGRPPAVRIAIIAALLLGGYLLFEFGRVQADYNIVDAIEEKQALRGEIGDLEDQIVSLKQEIALLETHREVDREAYQVVESNLMELEQKIQEQTDAIAFYRGIVSPKDGGRGLRIQDFKLTRAPSEGHYNLRLVLVQVMQHDRSVKGEVAFSVNGAQNGEEMTYSLEQLIPEDADSNWPFAFRYFQDFDRELVLPEGFEPRSVNVEVISRTRSIASVKQSYDWPAGSG